MSSQLLDNNKKLTDNLMSMFESVIDTRESYFSDNPNESPDKRRIPSIIKSYSNKNAAISAGVGLIPGPFGMVAAIPEIALIIRNQLAMVYDIAFHLENDKKMTKELLAGIFISGTGSAAIGLLVMHGSKVLVKQASLRVFKNIIKKLAGSILQKVAKSAVTKWLPVVGAAAMAVWSKITTNKIGEKAFEILQKEIEIESEIVESIDIENDISTVTNVINHIDIDLIKIHCLINMMKIDKEIDKREIKYIETICDNLELDDIDLQEIGESFTNQDLFEINLDPIIDSDELSIGLISDMIAISKVDENIHPSERIYLKKIAKKLGISKEDLDDLLIF